VNRRWESLGGSRVRALFVLEKKEEQTPQKKKTKRTKIFEKKSKFFLAFFLLSLSSQKSKPVSLDVDIP
jgi:hypothetical protein